MRLLFLYGDGRRGYHDVLNDGRWHWSIREYPEPSFSLRDAAEGYAMPALRRGIELTFERYLIKFPPEFVGPLESEWETVRIMDESPFGWGRQHAGWRIMHVMVNGAARDRLRVLRAFDAAWKAAGSLL